jgi:hypothetical protein
MQIEPTWWISVIEVPVVAALFRMLYGLKQEIQNRIERGDTRDSEAVARTRDELAEFKLEVTRTYVPLQGAAISLRTPEKFLQTVRQPTNKPSSRRAFAIPRTGRNWANLEPEAVVAAPTGRTAASARGPPPTRPAGGRWPTATGSARPCPAASASPKSPVETPRR